VGRRAALLADRIEEGITPIAGIIWHASAKPWAVNHE
jgi:hypothetical protein